MTDREKEGKRPLGGFLAWGLERSASGPGKSLGGRQGTRDWAARLKDKQAREAKGKGTERPGGCQASGRERQARGRGQPNRAKAREQRPDE